MRISIEGHGARLMAAYLRDLLSANGLPVEPVVDGTVPSHGVALHWRAFRLGEDMRFPIEVDWKESDRPPVARLSDSLEFDAEVSDIYPTIKGTWITAGHVVSLVVDGHDLNGILATHPELCEGDVRACLEWALAHEEIGGFDQEAFFGTGTAAHMQGETLDV